MSRVKDIVKERMMHAVEEGQSVAEVVRRMAEVNVGAILVMQNGQLRGVFSERDLMVRVVLAGRDPSATPVEGVMSTDVVTISDEATPEEAMESMQKHNCRHLPVVRGTAVNGFLSMRDLMNYELAQKTEEIDHMKAYIHGAA